MARLLLDNGKRLSVKESLAQIERLKIHEDEQLPLHCQDGSEIKLGRKTILDIRDQL